MADYEAAPEGGIKEAGAEQAPVAPVAAPEEVKAPVEAAPEGENVEKESSDAEKAEGEGDE